MTSREDSGSGVAIVTGAAKRIGAVIVETMHRRGLNVVIHCRGSREEAEALARRLNSNRAESAIVVQADLADRSAPDRIVGAALDAFGRIDALVNNASAFYPTPIGKADQDQWDELMTSNLRAPFFLSQAAVPHLGEHAGAIVNLVDVHGVVPMQRHAVYCQAKAGLVMQTRSLAKELAPRVRVNAVAPGAILWPEHDQSPEAEADILDRIPMQRPGRPEDIAGAVAFLALDAPYITGQILAVDGGRLLSV